MNKFLATCLGLATMLSCVGTESADELVPAISYPTTGSIERLYRGLDSIVSLHAVNEVLFEGLEWAELPFSTRASLS